MGERRDLAGSAWQSLEPAGCDAPGKGEILVGFGFRCWLSGYLTGNIQSWESCWNHYCRELGSRNARSAMTDLSSWVNSVRCHALRDIELSAGDCRSFCKDERLAITLIAASAGGACPALKACASALLGTDQVEPVLRTSTHFAITLETAGVRFPAASMQTERMALLN